MTNRPVLPIMITLLNKLQGVKGKSSGGFMAFCPSHNDGKQRGLSIDERDGKLLVSCFAGCTTESVLQTIGLSMTDLFSESPPKLPQSSPKTRQLLREIVYPITPTIDHVRLEYDDGSKSFTWRRDGKNGLGGLPTADLPLYGVERIVNGSATDTGYVFICEGEKAADSLWKRGFTAVATVSGAAGCPSPKVLWDAFGDPERFGQIQVLWPDNDAPGMKHMEMVARNLPFGCLPLYVIIPHAGDKYDAADFMGDVAQVEFKKWEKYALFDERSQPPPTQQTAGQQGWSGW